jgi:hypothetical protein
MILTGAKKIVDDLKNLSLSQSMEACKNAIQAKLNNDDPQSNADILNELLTKSNEFNEWIGTQYASDPANTAHFCAQLAIWHEECKITANEAIKKELQQKIATILHDNKLSTKGAYILETYLCIPMSGVSGVSYMMLGALGAAIPFVGWAGTAVMMAASPLALALARAYGDHERRQWTYSEKCEFFAAMVAELILNDESALVNQSWTNLINEIQQVKPVFASDKYTINQTSDDGITIQNGTITIPYTFQDAKEILGETEATKLHNALIQCSNLSTNQAKTLKPFHSQIQAIAAKKGLVASPHQLRSQDIQLMKKAITEGMCFIASKDPALGKKLIEKMGNKTSAICKFLDIRSNKPFHSPKEEITSQGTLENIKKQVEKTRIGYVSQFTNSSFKSRENDSSIASNNNVQKALYLFQYRQLCASLERALEIYSEKRKFLPPSANRRGHMGTIRQVIADSDIAMNVNPEQSLDALVTAIQKAANNAQKEHQCHFRPGFFSGNKDSSFSELMKIALEYVPHVVASSEVVIQSPMGHRR